MSTPCSSLFYFFSAKLLGVSLRLFFLLGPLLKLYLPESIYFSSGAETQAEPCLKHRCRLSTISYIYVVSILVFNCRLVASTSWSMAQTFLMLDT